MENIKQQLLTIIQSLPDSEEKIALLAKVNSSELSQQLIDEAGEAVSSSLDYYQNEVVKALAEADEQIEGVMKEYGKQMKELGKKDSQKQTQVQIEDLRKKIAS